MRKIACVFSFSESTWVSCQKIVFNLHRAYEKLPGVELKNFNYGNDTTGPDIENISALLEDYSPDEIVILDHKPHPLRLFKSLEWLKEKKPRITFHVFGDFTLYYRDWNSLSKLLTGLPVGFIVASERQKRLIDLFLPDGQGSKVCPFPVRADEFFYSPEERKLQRKAWGVSDDELVFVFTGRISRQKRTHLLLNAVDEVLRKTGAKARLYVYGSADHVGDNFLNVWENENEYFRRIHRQWKALPDSSRQRIRLMGPVPNSELRAVYAGADYLLNLSVHNDEDYGMSVAEAQMCGLPAILTDWGGLASFEVPGMPGATRFIPVRIGERSKLISRAVLLKTLEEVLSPSPRPDRKKLEAEARKRFSVEAASAILKKIRAEAPPVFQEFSEFHQDIALRMEHSRPVYLTRTQAVHPIYRKLYSSYVRNP